MRMFYRSEAPKILTVIKNGKPLWQVYGEKYAQKRLAKAQSLFKFQWPQVKGKTLNQHLLPDLKAMTDDHCSYCDGFPLKRGDDTIDHFHPKTHTAFYKEVCKWENLYIACKHCQDAKGDYFEEKLLRPDGADYQYNRYFLYDYIQHKILPNPLASFLEQERAEKTIKILDLNHISLCISRRHSFQRHDKDDNPVLSDYNFRFMFE